MITSKTASFVFKAHNLRYDGLNKYFTTQKSNVYHADKHCHNLMGSMITMTESHKISQFAKGCDHCTVDNPQFKKTKDELIQE